LSVTWREAHRLGQFEERTIMRNFGPLRERRIKFANVRLHSVYFYIVMVMKLRRLSGETQAAILWRREIIKYLFKIPKRNGMLRIYISRSDDNIKIALKQKKKNEKVWHG
jgi:hypothetical protein